MILQEKYIKLIFASILSLSYLFFAQVGSNFKYYYISFFLLSLVCMLSFFYFKNNRQKTKKQQFFFISLILMVLVEAFIYAYSVWNLWYFSFFVLALMSVIIVLDFDKYDIVHIKYTFLLPFLGLIYPFRYFLKKYGKQQVMHNVKLSVVPFLFTCVFFLFFYLSNPTWRKFVNQFIEFDLFFRFCISLIIFLYAWVFLNAEKIIYKKEIKNIQLSGFLSSIHQEKTFFIFLIMINFLFFAYTITDLIDFFNDYSHQSLTYVKLFDNNIVPLLLTTILVIVMFFLAPNQYESQFKKFSYFFTYTWIGNNIILVFISFYRVFSNMLNFGLTSMRISGIIALFLLLFFLISLLIKIKTKSKKVIFFNNLFLIALCILFIFSFISLKSISALYNIQHSNEIKENGIRIPMHYYTSVENLWAYVWVLENEKEISPELENQFQMLYARLETMMLTKSVKFKRLMYQRLYYKIQKLQ